MCGIAYLELTQQKVGKVTTEFVRQAKKYLARRGPDGNRTIEIKMRNSTAIMMHYRLAIQDLDPRALQPMMSDDELIHLIFNGEIYNFLELRAELVKEHGVTFKTSSDTEVLLRGYEFCGLDFLNKVEGMYAFVIHDKRTGHTLIGRDHAGMKPLYYSNTAGVLAVASDVRVISKSLHQEFSDKGIAQYFCFGYCLAPSTIFADIYQVKPGEVITFKGTNKTATRLIFDVISEFSISRTPSDFSYFCAETQSGISKTMEQHIRADVPVGLMASGGIDTRLLGFGLDKSYGEKRIDYTWTIKKPDNDWEHRAAASISKKLKAKHEIVNAPEGSDYLKAALRSMTHPCVDMAVLFTWFLGKQARQKKCPVLLSGVGGDELFFGYNRYGSAIRQKSFAYLRMMSALPKYPKTLEATRYHSPTFGMVTSVLGSFGVLKSLFSDNQLYQLLAGEFLELDKKLLSIDGHVHRMLAVDLMTYVPNQLCLISDGALMDSSIEGRLPLLSKSMIKKTAIASPNHLYKNNNLKGGLKTFLYDRGWMEDYYGKSGFGDNNLTKLGDHKKQQLLDDCGLTVSHFRDFSDQQFDNFSHVDLLKLKFLNIWLST